MYSNLEVSLKYVLAHEGGYVNHPKDPGGATNMGVTQRVYDGYRARKKLQPQSVRAITPDEVAEIYKRQYWDVVKGDELPSGLDYAVFDYAVNSGPSRAAKELQKILGVPVDGMIGQVTLGAVAQHDVFDLIEKLCQNRMAFLKRLKHWPTFGRGWTARVMGVQDGSQMDDIGVIDRAMKLATGADVSMIQIPAMAIAGKAEETERSSPLQSSTVQAVMAQAGAVGGTALATFNSLDDTTKIVMLGLLGVAFLSSMWIFRERIRKWADGDR